MEHKLQIEFIFKIPSKYTFKKFQFPIQNHIFKYGLNIKNIGGKVFPGATLKNIKIYSKEHDKTLIQPKEFSCHSLNPDESIEIWLDQITAILDGILWLTVDLIPNDINDIISTYQLDKDSKEATIYLKKNNWGNIFFIQGEMELEQARTNSYILILTLLTFLEGVFGLRNIIVAILKLFQYILQIIADLIGKLLS